ncbi:hypothetical protein M413DRAFT_421887, partial [Hebeloma cylindrosporum]
ELNGLAYAHGAGYNTTKQCLAGTRIEILTEIAQWACSADPNIPPVFWLNGAAGTGKSAIAHTLAVWFNQHNALGSFLCFDRNYLAERRHEKVFSTMAYDLASRTPGVKQLLAATIRERNWLKQTPDIIQQWESLLIGPSAQLPTDHPILLIIDALDESGDAQSRNHLLSILGHRARELPLNVRMLITSRPLDDISQALHRSSHIKSKVISDIPKSFIDRDITSYISARLSQIPDFFVDANRLHFLVNSSEGLFQWAFVACEFIQGNGRLSSPEQRFLKLFNSSMTITSLTKLDALYDTILQEICADNDKDDMHAFRSVMGQILASFEPLSLDALIAIRNYFPFGNAISISSVLKHLGSVLSGVTGHSIPVQLLHTSFRDYLTDPSRSKHFYIDTSFHRNDIAFATLQVMKTELHFNICKLETSYLLNSEVQNLSQKIEQFISPSLSYSCRYWASHVHATPFNSKVAGKIREFLNKQFLFWIEVLSLVKSIQIASQSVSLIITWINCTDILAFARDAQKFVRMFGNIIEQSTPHLYLSALSFTPQSSTIYRTFADEVFQIARVSSRPITSWPVCQNILQGHTDIVTAIAFSPDGKHIISGSQDKTLRIWDAETGNAVGLPLEGHDEIVWQVAFSPDGKHIIRWIIAGQSDGAIYIWDAITGQVLCEPLEGHIDSKVWVAAFSPNGKWIAVGYYDGTILIWDKITRNIVGVPLNWHTSPVCCIAFSSDGKHIVSCSGDKIIIWNTESHQVRGAFQGHTNFLNAVAFSPDNKHIISCSDDHTIRIWDAEITEQMTELLQEHIKVIHSVEFSPDGQHILACLKDSIFSIVSNSVCIWDTESGEAVAMPIEDLSDMTFMSFLPDGKHIISYLEDTLWIWDVETGEAIGALEEYTSCDISVAFLPDGRYVIAGVTVNPRTVTVHIWDKSTGEFMIVPLEGWHACVLTIVGCIAFSPNGNYISIGMNDNICTWNTQTGRAVGELCGHTATVLTLAFSSDGTYLISGAEDNTIRIWDMNSDRNVGLPLEGHNCAITSVAFSPDDKYIVSGSYDKTIRIWYAMTGETISVLEGHTNRVNSVAFSPDGKHIISGSDDKTICIWNADIIESAVSIEFITPKIQFSSNPHHALCGVHYLFENAMDTVGDWRDAIQVQQDGWILGPHGRLLLWVPPMYLPGLYRPRTKHFIGIVPMELDLSNFAHGPLWEFCKIRNL